MSIVISAASVLIAFCSLIICIFKDSKNDASVMATVIAKLDSIEQCCGEMRTDIKDMKNDISAHAQRLAVLEQKVKGLEKEVFK